MSVAIPRTKTYAMTSRAGHDYRVLVAWPDESTPPTGFPVVVLLDANATFGTTVESVRMRSHRPASTGVGPAIVVGIAYETDGPYERAHRRRDFTPGPATDATVGASDVGGANAFLEFIAGDVWPTVRAAHDVDEERTTLVGHSLGGLFVVHTLLTSPRSFRNYVAMSPSLWWNADDLLARADAWGSHLEIGSNPTRVMLTVGEFEQAIAPWQHGLDAAEVTRRRTDRAMVDRTQDLASRLARTAGSRADVRCHVLPDEDHASIVGASLSRALRFVLAP